jgi:3-phosphoshikimate 1-carboxyvinyltransferase
MKYRSMSSRVSGILRAPPSKSVTHRAMVLAGLSTGVCRIHRPLHAEDTAATRAGMEAFGAGFESSGDDLRVQPTPLRVPIHPIDVQNSGTTLRLLAGVASLVEGVSTLTGDASIRRRPMGPLLAALTALGGSNKALGPDGRPPVEVRGILRGGSARLPGDVSSQFLSSLLIACPLAQEETVIDVMPPQHSRPYVDMTRDMVVAMGGEITKNRGTYRIAGGQTYHPKDIEVPGDFSSAAFPLVAAAITDGDVTMTGLDSAESDGDRAIVNQLRAFGAEVDVREDRIRVQGGPLVAQTLDVGDIPDLFPALAVLASQSEGETRFVNGSHLRFKESDRIEATVAMLRALGGHAQETEDGCVVSGPTRLLAGSVDSRGDHRILMAAAVAGLVARGPVDISDPWCFRASYPSFLDDMRNLGALQAVIA